MDISIEEGYFVIKWSDEYLIGIEELDKQHEKLFEIAGRAFDLFKNNVYTDKYDRIIEILEELKEYAKYHFKAEEDYMISIGNRKIFSHKIEHVEFIKKVESVDLNKVDENQDKYLLSILEFVINWTSDHILHKDKAMVQ